MTPDSEPLSSYDHTTVPTIAISTIKTRFQGTHWKSPGKIWEAARNRPWLTPVMDMRTRYEQIVLCGITFDLPGGDFSSMDEAYAISNAGRR